MGRWKWYGVYKRAIPSNGFTSTHLPPAPLLLSPPPTLIFGTIFYTHAYTLYHPCMPPAGYTFIASDGLGVPPTVNEVEENERRELLLSDRKASKVLGVTVLRAPRLTIIQKASKILGTDVVRSGTDWEMWVNRGFASPRRNRLREKFLMANVAPLILGGSEEREGVSGSEGQRVVLSPRWKSSRMVRRYTISCESGLDLLLPSAPSSPTSMTISLSPAGSTFAEPLPEGSGSSLDLGVESEDPVSETATLVDLGIVPPPVPTSCPPSPISPSTPIPLDGVPVSPTARKNPVLQRRREMIRSANKSVQILGIEARRAILNKMEKENAGRIGWSGV